MLARRKSAAWGRHEDDLGSQLLLANPWQSSLPLAAKGTHAAGSAGLMLRARSLPQKSVGFCGSSSTPTSSTCSATPSSLRQSGFGSLGALSLQQPQSSTARSMSLVGFGACAEQARLLEERSVRCVLLVESEFDIACFVSLEQGQIDGADLPLVIPAGKPSSTSLVGGSNGIDGSITLEGFKQALPFRVRAAAPSGAAAGSGAANFVVEPGRLRTMVVCPAAQAPSEQEGVDSPVETASLPAGVAGAPGVVAEFRISNDSLAKMSISLRLATEGQVRQSRLGMACAVRDMN